MEHQSDARAFAASSTAAAPRMDIYATIHKALRAMMMDTLHAVGRIDVHDTAELRSVCERVLELADICASHLGHENDFVHPAMEARRPGASGHVASEHVEHLAAIAQLRGAVSGLCAACRGPVREQAALDLYRRLALFVAENFAHMQIEETEHNRVLWDCYSDDELRALEGRIVASLPPSENLTIMRWLIPAMTPAERAELLAQMQAAAPAPAFAAVLDTVQPYLSQRDWAKLGSALAPAQVPAWIVA